MIQILAVLLLTGVTFADPIPMLDRAGKVAIEARPYHVGVQLKGVTHCSGVILSKDWILTAGACVSHGYPKHYSIRAGTSDSRHEGSVHNVSRIILHEDYTENLMSGRTRNDIALVQLTTPLTLDATRQPIGELYGSSEVTKVGTVGEISGFGSFNNRPENQYALLTQEIETISNDLCHVSFDPDKTQLCAIYIATTPVLRQNDAGGPLTVNGRLAGITVRGMGANNQNEQHIIYSNVGFFRDWIKKNSGI